MQEPRQRDNSWARDLLARAQPPLAEVVVDDNFLEELLKTEELRKAFVEETPMQKFKRKLSSISDSSLTLIMQRTLDLASLQQQLKARCTKTMRRKLRRLVRVAKLSGHFWAFNAQQREELLSDANVYVFETPQGEPEELPERPAAGHPRPGPVGPAAVRRRSKQAPRQEKTSSQLSRDLDADIWTASWGTRRMKPWSLLRWATQHSCQPEWLQLLFSKVEKGHCYYSSQPLSASRLVAELQARCTLQDFYSRLPLLASPSTPYDLGDVADVAVHIVEDIKMPKGDVLTDGFAEISLKLARKLNLVSGEQVRQGVYDAYQFRGLVRDAATGDALIVKGMFVVIETDEDVMYIRKSCEKIRFKPSAEFSSFSQELDVVQSTAAPQGQPKLNAQLCAALGMRACLLPTRAARLSAMADLRDFCRSRRADTADAMEAESWGFARGPPEHSPGIAMTALGTPASRPVSSNPTRNFIPQHRVKLTYVAHIEDPTPLEHLHTTVDLPQPWSLPELGTKEALLRGGRRFLAAARRQQKKPQLRLRGVGGACFALPDLWGKLEEPQQCHIIREGRCITGPVAVWRNPVMLPSDIEIWESVPLPDDATLVPNNCIICSCKGMGVLALAGGDYDGDVVFFSSDRDLLEFVANAPDGLHHRSWQSGLRGGR